MERRSIPARILLAVTGLTLAGLMASPVQAQLDPEMTLTPSTRYPLLGVQMDFVMTGPPGALYQLRGATEPEAENDPLWGLTFLKNDGRIIGSGNLDSNGEATVSFAPPNDPAWADRLVYFQVYGYDGVNRGTSNQVVLRVQEAPPSGPREPQSITVTPSGEKAYVAHEEDGTVSVIDVATDTLLYNIPVSPVPPSIGFPSKIRTDPIGRHIFVINPQFRRVTSIHRKTDSIAAQFPVPPASRDIAFDFGDEDVLFITNEKDNAVLVFLEEPAGNYTQIDSIAVEGKGPGAIVVLPDGKLAVANRSTHDVEILDPKLPVGSRTVARTPIGTAVPNDLVVLGNSLMVPTFTQNGIPDEPDGVNEVLEIELSGFTVVDRLLPDLGTDYWDAELASNYFAVTGTGSGTIVFADPSDLSFVDAVELAPGAPLTVPMELAFVPNSQGGAPQKLYAINHFRETLRAIDLSQGAPFALGAEVPLAWSGQPRVPGVDLNQIENGEWFYASIAFFNGSASNLNPVTCNTCHPNTFSDGLNNKKVRQSQSFHDLGSTGPWLHNGARVSLLEKTGTLFSAHGAAGGVLQPDAEADLTAFQESGTELTISPFLNANGTRTAAAIAGEDVFNGVGNCASCHQAPLYIPADLGSRTVELGVGTGLAPINIPSLRGLWASAPYLHDSSAVTLREVLTTFNPSDEHGTTSTMTNQQLDDLIEFLLSL